MIRRNQPFIGLLNRLTDFVIVVACYVLASRIRLIALGGDRSNIALSGRMLIMSMLLAAALVFILTLIDFYDGSRTRRPEASIGLLLAAVTLTVLIAGALLFVFRLPDFSRGVVALFYPLTFALLTLKYLLTRIIQRNLRSGGRASVHEVVIGDGHLAAQYARDVSSEPELGVCIDGFVGETAPEGGKLLGGIENLDAALSDSGIDEAVIALDPENYTQISSAIAACEKNGVKYLIIPFYNDLMPSHPVIERVGRSKLIDVRANRLDNVGWSAVKRTFDVAVSAAGLIILSPLLGLIALGVKLSSPGPVLFRQTRVGYMRREFKMLKFRSMRVNSEENSAWTHDADARRTRFGSFIRKTSLDELPQLWNVLTGQMSLIGPRPELPAFVEKFKNTVPLYMVKHQVKPGITGWAQVNGYRGDTSIAKRIELDLWYIDNWSVLLDVRILLRTAFGGMINREVMYGGDAQTPDIRIAVATHKKYPMPQDEMYLPVHAGRAGKPDLGYIGDDTGDNISFKNPGYCELTVLYWAWKNLESEYVGLAHYRRLFGKKRSPLTAAQAGRLLRKADVLLPKERHYRIETNYSQYAHAHHARDLDLTREIIVEKYPAYLESFDRVMQRTHGHRFNMLIMKRDILDSYCSWLFGVLFELEAHLDVSSYTGNDRRVFGFVGERLLDVWLETSGTAYRDVPYAFLEKQNWLKKGAMFVMRKLKGGRA